MESSRAYYMSHIALRDTVYFNWQEFIQAFNKGPNEIQTYLANMWNGIESKYFKEGTKIVDIERNISKDDFKVFVETLQDVLTIFIVFPQTEIKMAQAQIVAISLCEKMPRYITLESWTEQEANRMREMLKDEYVPSYTIGEWKFIDDHFEHVNYGQIKDVSVGEFVHFVDNNILKQSKEEE